MQTGVEKSCPRKTNLKSFFFVLSVDSRLHYNAANLQTAHKKSLSSDFGNVSNGNGDFISGLSVSLKLPQPIPRPTHYVSCQPSRPLSLKQQQQNENVSSKYIEIFHEKRNRKRYKKTLKNNVRGNKKAKCQLKAKIGKMSE